MRRAMGALRAVVAATALGMVAGLAHPSGVSAQQPARYLWVATIQAKFGQVPDFIEYERQIQEARRRTGDPRTVSVYQLQTGGPPNRFDAVIGFNDLSEMDSWPSVTDLLTRAFGERDGARIYAEGTAALESVDYSVHVLHPEHSSGSNRPVSGTTLTNLVTTRVRPELADDYNAFLSALKVAEDKRGIRRGRRTVTLGELSTYTAVNQASDWATLRADPGPPAVIIDEYGEAVGGTLLAKASAAVISRTIQVFRLREDLSYSPN